MYFMPSVPDSPFMSNMQFHVNHIKNNVFWHLSMHNNTHKIPDLHTQKNNSRSNY